MLESHRRADLTALLARTTDNIRLPQEWRNFFDEEQALRGWPDEQRRFARQVCRIKSVLAVQKQLREDTHIDRLYCVYFRDLSRSGLSFVAARQFFPGDEILVRGPRSWIPVSIAYCQRKNERCWLHGGAFLNQD